jgi:predicted O-methyltransferase YrrM
MPAKILEKIVRKAAAIRHRSMLQQCRQIDGWLTKREALGLFLIAKRMPSGARILEIGSWKGKSTFALASGLASGTIFALDPFDAAGEPESREAYEKQRGDMPLLDQFKANLGGQGLWNKISVCQGYSSDFAGKFQDLDFVFIDGDHSKEGCAYDFLTFSGAVKSGGLIGFHDYDPDRQDFGPTWVVENHVKKSPLWEFSEKWDSLIVFERRTAS